MADEKCVIGSQQPHLTDISPTADILKNRSEVDKDVSSESSQSGLLSKCLNVLNWTPPWCRFDPEQPPEFSLFQNILFAFAGAFTVANLYYNHPILNILAHDFNVSYLEVSQVPTLMQAGYAVGLLMICPLGDLFPRRPYTLSLICITATLWIGLCVTNSFHVFLGISFVTAVTTVTPQIMLPLVGELAPPKRRPLALSIVVSGNLLGIVLARILSGVVTNYTSWRNIYWIALALQYTILILLWLFMPAYPATNPTPSLRGFLVAYPKLLFNILQLCYRHPVLVQAGAVSFCISGSFMSYWTTLTFLLSSSPYNLSPTPIGLFGLIGVAGIFLGPIYAKYLIQPLKVPLYSVLIGAFVNLIGCIIGTYTGELTLAGPIIQALGLDAGLQITQIANRSAIYGVAPTSRNRVNTAFMLCTFMGQLTGTSAGNKLYEMAGWKGSGSLGVGLVVMSMIFSVARGPWEERWVGWQGGWGKEQRLHSSTTHSKTQEDTSDRGSTQAAEDIEGKELDVEQQRTNVRSLMLSRQQSYGSDGHATAS